VIPYACRRPVLLSVEESAFTAHRFLPLAIAAPSLLPIDENAFLPVTATLPDARPCPFAMVDLNRVPAPRAYQRKRRIAARQGMASAGTVRPECSRLPALSQSNHVIEIAMKVSEDETKALEACARRAARRVGLIARKCRSGVGTCDNRGGFMLIDMSNRIKAGEHFELTAPPTKRALLPQGSSAGQGLRGDVARSSFFHRQVLTHDCESPSQEEQPLFSAERGKAVGAQSFNQPFLNGDQLLVSDGMTAGDLQRPFIAFQPTTVTFCFIPLHPTVTAFAR